MRVFLSSTGDDFVEHRRAVMDALRSMGLEAVGREDWRRLHVDTLGARLSEVDVVLALVGHLRDTPVSRVRGGDGVHSWAWYELREARRLDKPILGYVATGEMTETPAQGPVRPVAPLSKRERERLTIQSELLEELRTEVRKLGGRDISEPGELVATIRGDLHSRTGVFQRAQKTERWEPGLAHLLHAAPDFLGRSDPRERLTEWLASPGTPERVVALVARGGTGKTALLEHVLRPRLAAPLVAGGTFVWSFYEDPAPERCLEAAARYFDRSRVEHDAAPLERLKTAFRGSRDHLLVLDGVEAVQLEGGSETRRGALADPALRELLRLLAGGHLGRSRAILTSRWPLPELAPWEGQGFRTERLADLDPESAQTLLRRKGFAGSETELRALTSRLENHALSVSVLGNYLEALGGDPRVVERILESEDFSSERSSSTKLGRLLERYRDELPEDAREAMGLLSLLPHGLSLHTLEAVVRADMRPGLSKRTRPLADLLEELCRTGLAFRRLDPDGARYSAHPFVRETFRELSFASSEDILAVLRPRLAGALESHGGEALRDEAWASRYEELISVMIHAGQVDEAHLLYRDALGGFETLGLRLGMYGFGARITEMLVEALPKEEGGPSNFAAFDLGAFQLLRGDLERARHTWNGALADFLVVGDDTHATLAVDALAFISMHQGRLEEARAEAEWGVGLSRSAPKPMRRTSLSMLGHVELLCGDIESSRQLFEEASRFEDEPFLSSRPGLRKAELDLMTGRVDAAVTLTRRNLELCRAKHGGRDVAECRELLGRAAVKRDLTEAHAHLDAFSRWVSSAGETLLVPRVHCLASAVYLEEGRPGDALSEAEEGLAVAEAHEFGLVALDLRLAMARAHLARSDPDRALSVATKALLDSMVPDRIYPWGRADATHLCGRAYVKLGDREEARKCFVDALAERRRLQHPGVEETTAALAALG